MGERINSWKNQLSEPQSSVDYELTKNEFVTRTEKAPEGLGAELYDQHVTETDDVRFILDLIGAQPKKALEVCCGSGRILVPLAKAGHDATGFDNDEPMMDRIPPKAAGLNNIQWRKADAVHDDWGSGFDVVVLTVGFIIEFEYQDFDKNPINDESRSVIIYAKKADE